jgi:hypothetical protein
MGFQNGFFAPVNGSAGIEKLSRSLDRHAHSSRMVSVSRLVAGATEARARLRVETEKTRQNLVKHFFHFFR